MTSSPNINAERYVEAATASIFEHYLGEYGAKIANCLADANRDMPPIVRALIGDSSYRPQAADRQISWGVTRRDNKLKVALLVEKAHSHAAEIADRIGAAYPGSVVQLTAARAHSSAPQAKVHRAWSLAPGSSIGHTEGFPGSIGCLVRSLEDGEDWPGLVSASHVLSKSNRAKSGDAILVPGHPDGPRISNHQCGSLARFLILPDYDQDLLESNYLCCTDAALVKFERQKNCRHTLPEATYVPDPKNPDKLMAVCEVIGGDVVAERLGERVYKMGRTTGLTDGILDLVGVQRQIILISGKEYVYTNVLGVRQAPGRDKPFSQPGDSGSLVYTHDGKGIGLIIGGSESISWLSPLDACLTELNVKLLS
ncbi:hypothetical protein IVB22_33490 [Bradyrhizobium sp. 190]|uniref:hypothetical protein n=1 Tax=Bradyrhizobium sp. 190 TaxID=2782658 RepID=UPI001FFBB1DE|nr:hypothetical protein [Bradyrhizobium sp. 190]MCK1517334.1 hypothetical protein [Bradyrhizobium sp. 190]